ncbi:hypothetical protein ACFL5V_00670 [Fibrobacterota bacterium]
MDVQFLIQDKSFQDKEEEQWKDIISKIIGNYAGEMGLPLEDLHEFVLADEEHFAGIAQRYRDIKTSSDNDRYSKLAKAILHKTEKGETKATLVVRRELIEQLFSRVEDKEKKWTYTEYLYKYVICHEMGHCLDYRNRPDDLREPGGETDKFSVRQMYTLFGSVLLDEVAACAHASRAMTTGVFHQEINSVSEGVERRLNELESIKDNYNGQPRALFELAVSASSIFWAILIQYAKLMGSKINNRDLASYRMKVWKGAGAGSGVLLSKLGSEIWELWKQYPDWKGADLTFLLEAWYRISIESGFKFVETPEGDGVYWE